MGTATRASTASVISIAIRVADELRTQGIEVHKLRRVVEYLRQRKGLELTASDVLANTMLISDGHDVYEVEGDVTVSTLPQTGSARAS